MKSNFFLTLLLFVLSGYSQKDFDSLRCYLKWHGNIIKKECKGKETYYFKEKDIEFPIYKVTSKDILNVIEVITNVIEFGIRKYYKSKVVSYYFGMSIEESKEKDKILLYFQVEQSFSNGYLVFGEGPSIFPSSSSIVGMTFFNHVPIYIMVDVENLEKLKFIIEKTNVNLILPVYKERNNTNIFLIDDTPKFLELVLRYNRKNQKFEIFYLVGEFCLEFYEHIQQMNLDDCEKFIFPEEVVEEIISYHKWVWGN